MASLPGSDSVYASGLDSGKLNLPTLQAGMKLDPESYRSDLTLVYSQFKSFLALLQQQSTQSFNSLSGVDPDSTVAKDLSARALLLAHVTPSYPNELDRFPNELIEFLEFSARSLPSGLRLDVTKALIFLTNKKIVDIADILVLFMELQTIGDKVLKKYAFSHVVHGIRRMNQTRKDGVKMKELQNIMFRMLQDGDETRAKCALTTLCDLFRRRVWVDDRTSNAICMACLHTSSRVMTAAVSFLLDFEKIENDDSDDSGIEDDDTTPQSRIVPDKEAVYKAYHKGTTSSKKKKKAKLKRVANSMRKQQRLSSDKNNHCSPLLNVTDAQGFAEKLFSRVQTCHESIKMRVMLLKVISRTVALHRLVLLKLPGYLVKYVKPGQRYCMDVLAVAVQCCHDMVPPDAVEPLLAGVVQNFVQDRLSSDVIAVGLNSVREICLRMPSLMTDYLLQDLVLYRKSKEKGVSCAARSLLNLFRDVNPSLLNKKDRGRPADQKARPKAFGEVHVSSGVPGLELLEQDDGDGFDERDGLSSGSDNEDLGGTSLMQKDSDNESYGDPALQFGASGDEMVDGNNCEENEDLLHDEVLDKDVDSDSDEINEEWEEDSSFDAADEMEFVDLQYDDYKSYEDDNLDHSEKEHGSRKDGDVGSSKAKKRKCFDFHLDLADESIRALKKLAVATSNASVDRDYDGILSNEYFKRIKELNAANKGSKKFGHLNTKRFDPSKLEDNLRKKMTKKEKLALVKAGREERDPYQARTAIKQKKVGGSSNLQKERKKAMPLAAKRTKIAKSRQAKKKVERRAGKQFRGRKAWK